MKKFITLAVVAAALLGGAVRAQAEDACCPAEGAKAEKHIAIGSGFKKLWHEPRFTRRTAWMRS